MLPELLVDEHSLVEPVPSFRGVLLQAGLIRSELFKTGLVRGDSGNNLVSIFSSSHLPNQVHLVSGLFCCIFDGTCRLLELFLDPFVHSGPEKHCQNLLALPGIETRS